MPRKKLKVFIDAEVLTAPHFSGIGHYTLEILRALDSLIDNRNDIRITLGVYYGHLDKIRGYNFKNFRIRPSLLSLRTNNALKIRGIQPPYDLFFGHHVYLFPNFTSWPLLFSKSVSIIYDLSFEFYPQYVEPRNQKFLSQNVKKSAARSNRIITISKNSKEEILKYYGLPNNKVSVVYPGIDQRVFYKRPSDEIAKVKARYGVQGKYILFVGNIEPRKNLKGLLLAYEKLDPSIRKEYSLLLVGASGWLDDEIYKIIKRLRTSGNHIQQPNDYIVDKDRPAIYSGAELFVFPSFYEGFGIPPVEALACGVPVIVSDNSSLPEAVGSSAKFVRASDVNSIVKAITQVLRDDSLRNKMRVDGYAQAGKFSWEAEAKKLLKILTEVGE